MERRTLVLRGERLSELTTDELRAVAGGEVSKLACVTIPADFVSDFVMSLCGCLTNYCSIDVC